MRGRAQVHLGEIAQQNRSRKQWITTSDLARRGLPWTKTKCRSDLLSPDESATIPGLMEWAQCPLFSHEQLKYSFGASKPRAEQQ